MTHVLPRNHSPFSRFWSSLVLLCTLLSLAALTGCEVPRVRKNVKELTAEEKRDFVEAVLKLKQTPSPFNEQISWYDQFVVFHKQVTRASIMEYAQGHNHSTFLPWHRKLLMLYEDALREVSGKKDLTLPYWDWTDPASTQAVFADDFMGPGGNPDTGYEVLSGPFNRNAWTLNIMPDNPTDLERAGGKGTTWLVRALGVDSGNLDDKTQQKKYSVRLPTTEDMERCLAVPTFDQAPWNKLASPDESFRNCLEGFDGGADKSQYMHNIVHDWVAGMVLLPDGKIRYGTMEPLETSPNDPVFFLHHANVDRLWAQWESSHPDAYGPDGTGQAGWNPKDTLYPFNLYASAPEMTGKHDITIQSMLSIKALNYEYK